MESTLLPIKLSRDLGRENNGIVYSSFKSSLCLSDPYVGASTLNKCCIIVLPVLSFTCTKIGCA